MFAVNSGAAGCGAAAHDGGGAPLDRRDPLGRPPAPVDLSQPDLWPWHIDVQWIPQPQPFWAVYNAKTAERLHHAGGLPGREHGRAGLAGACRQPVLVKGAIPELQDIVYRTTFEYDPATDAITFWFSGARYERRPVPSGARRSSAVAGRTCSPGRPAAPRSTPRMLPPAPAPLEEWP